MAQNFLQPLSVFSRLSPHFAKRETLSLRYEKLC